MRKHVELLCVMMLINLGLGCGCGVSGNLERSASDIRKGAENAAETFKEGAKSIAEALPKIDPAGINRLLAENKELRDNVLLIQLRLAEAMHTGLVLNPTNSRILFKVDGYKGDLVITGWIDSRENTFLTSERFANQSLSLNYTPTIAQTLLDRFYAARRFPLFVNSQAFPILYNEATNLAASIDATYARTVSQAFNAFLQMPVIHPIQGRDAIDIQGRLVKPGFHKVFWRCDLRCRRHCGKSLITLSSSMAMAR